MASVRLRVTYDASCECATKFALTLDHLATRQDTFVSQCL